MYSLTIPSGKLTICAHTEREDVCELWLNNRHLHDFDSANAAARFVAQRASGHTEIDNAEISFPSDVEGWQWISVTAHAVAVAHSQH